VQELLLATRERFIAEVDEICVSTVHLLGPCGERLQQGAARP
jgi:hypothetical protein